MPAQLWQTAQCGCALPRAAGNCAAGLYTKHLAQRCASGGGSKSGSACGKPFDAQRPGALWSRPAAGGARASIPADAARCTLLARGRPTSAAVIGGCLAAHAASAGRLSVGTRSAGSSFGFCRGTISTVRCVQWENRGWKLLPILIRLALRSGVDETLTTERSELRLMTRCGAFDLRLLPSFGAGPAPRYSSAFD